MFEGVDTVFYLQCDKLIFVGGFLKIFGVAYCYPQNMIPCFIQTILSDLVLIVTGKTFFFYF